MSTVQLDINVSAGITESYDADNDNEIDALNGDDNMSMRSENTTEQNTSLNQDGVYGLEPLIDEATNENSNEVDPLGSIKTEFGRLYEIHARNSAEIDEICDEPEVVDLSDGEEMVVSELGIPKPFATTEENMIKRENDSITGNIPFNVKVSISNSVLNF